MFERRQVDVKLEKHLAWLNARDTFLGDNYTPQDIPKALKMMQSLDHDDAKWLCSLFPDPDGFDENDSYRILSDSNDPRGILYRNSITPNKVISLADIPTIMQLADKGHSFACVRLISNENWRRDHLHLVGTYIKTAVEADEPEGHLQLSKELRKEAKYRLKNGDKDKCKELKIEAIRHLKRCVDLNYTSGILEYSMIAFKHDSPEYFYYWGLAALRANPKSYAISIINIRRGINEINNIRNRKIILCEASRIFKELLLTNKLRGMRQDEINDIKELVAHYEAHCDKVRASINQWTLLARQKGVPKDIRLAISKWLWNQRFVTDYSSY